jgi:EpsI family protein
MRTFNATRRQLVLALGASAAASAGASLLRPQEKLALQLGPIGLPAAIPKQFGDWVADESQTSAIVNPQAQALLDQLYSETLNRTYINRVTGYRIMLAVAYGTDQRDELAVHYPEVCYPAQGFRVTTSEPGTLKVGTTPLPVKRVHAKLGTQRMEPITYWVMVGNEPTAGGLHKKLAVLQHTVRGVIPDGLLLRVSSIDPNLDRAYAQQDEFVAAMLSKVEPTARQRLAGY